MATGATGQLGLALPVQGELTGTWGNTVNNAITEYTNIAIAATLTLTNDGAVTLANTTGTDLATNIVSSLTGAGTVTAQFAIVRVTGTLTTAKVITGPSYSKTYVIDNAATGGIVTFKASGQTGVSVAVGEKCSVYFNGTDYVKVAGTVDTGVTSFTAGTTGFTPSSATSGAVTLAGTLATTNGGTGLTSFTANGVVYASSSSALATGGALTFNGVTLGVTSSAVNSGDINSTNANGSVVVFKNSGTAVGWVGNGSSGFTGASASDFGINGQTNLLFGVTGTENMRLNTTGLGIGTSSPSEKLTVQGNYKQSNGTQGIQIINTTVPYIQAFTSGGNNPLQINGQDLRFFTGASFGAESERFRFGPSGQFGIAGATYGTAGDVLTSGGASAAPTWTTPISLSADNTFTGTQTFSGTSSKLATILNDVAEVTTVSGVSITGTLTIDVTTSSVNYYQGNATGNWATNIRASSGTSLNTIMSIGQSVTVVAMVTQGGTAYYNTSVQIDGTTSGVTTKWQGGTAPSSGNASSIDVYSYTVIKTASATFTVFAVQTKFA
jgi:hypothetical protein